jgi:hypothetical protein
MNILLMFICFNLLIVIVIILKKIFVKYAVSFNSNNSNNIFVKYAVGIRPLLNGI